MVNDLAEGTMGGRGIKRGKQMRLTVVSRKEDSGARIWNYIMNIVEAWIGTWARPVSWISDDLRAQFKTADNLQWYFPALMPTRGAAQSSTLQIDAVDTDVTVQAVMQGGAGGKVCNYQNDWRKYTAGAYWVRLAC